MRSEDNVTTNFDPLLRGHDQSIIRRLKWVALVTVIWVLLCKWVMPAIGWLTVGRLLMPVGLLGAAVLAAGVVLGGRRHRARVEALLRNPHRAVRAYVASFQTREGLPVDKVVHIETVEGDIVTLWAADPLAALDALKALHPGLVIGVPPVPPVGP